jgi:ArpU family phage transcriptional regulator
LDVRKHLPPVDEQATESAVIDALEKYLLFKMVDYDPREASITQSYSERFHGPTNVTSDQTASVALSNVSEHEKRQKHIERVERAVSKLSRLQRNIITERYMKEPGVKDIEVYTDIIGISRKTFYKHRNDAFYLLAFSLSIYVVKE